MCCVILVQEKGFYLIKFMDHKCKSTGKFINYILSLFLGEIPNEKGRKELLRTYSITVVDPLH